MGSGTKPLAPLGVDATDDKVRRRLAEILSAAGNSHAQISLEVLYYLPKGFLDSYEAMFTRALKADSGESVRNKSQTQNGDLGKATGTAAKTTGKRFKRTYVVLDEKALNVKTRVDKRLRMLGREIEVLLAGGEVETIQAQCSHCGCFLESSWKFCPRDGRAQSAE